MNTPDPSVLPVSFEEAIAAGRAMVYTCDAITGAAIRSSNSRAFAGILQRGSIEDWSSLIVAEDMARYDELMAATAPEHHRYEIEYRFRHAITGGIYWVVDRGEVLFNANNARRSFRGVVSLIRNPGEATRIGVASRLQALAFEAARMGTWHFDARTGSLTCSDGLLKLLDLKREDFDGSAAALDGVVYPADLEIWLRTRDLARASDKRTESEFRVVLPRAGIRWFLSRADIVDDRKGSAVGCHGVMIDITERKTAEETAARLAAIVMSSDDAIISSNRGNRIISWNHGAEKLLGFSSSEIIGSPISRIIPEELWESEQESLDMVNSGFAIPAHESKLRHKNGLVLPISLSVSPVRNSSGKVVGASTIALDLGEARLDAQARRETDLRLLHAISAAKVGAFDYDIAGGTSNWSREMFSLHGLDPARPSPDLDAAIAMIAPAHQPLARKQIDEALRDGGQFAFEFPVLRPDGREVWMSMAGYVRRNAMGIATNARGILRDISERMEWQKRQTLLLRELSHRVKNSMAVIESVTRQTLRTTSNPADFAAAFEGRIRSLAASHTLLTTMEWKGASLRELIRLQTAGLVDDFDGRFVLHGPDVLLAAEPATRMGLVLHELATNAIKHGALSQTQGRVGVRWKRGRGKLFMTWSERQGPPASSGGPRGFGTSLVDSSVVEVKRRFGPEGLTCHMVFAT